MSGFLYGMLGALVLDVAALVAAAFLLPRLLKQAMRKQLGAAMFGAKPSAVVGRVSSYAENGAAVTTQTPVEGNRV